MADFRGKGAMASRNVIITLPAIGHRMDKNGKDLGYYADVELNQTDYDKQPDHAPQTNPHLISNKVTGKSGKTFLNHRFYYPISQINKMLAKAGDNVVYTTRDPNKKGASAYTEYDASEVGDKQPESFEKNLNSTRIAVKASLMTAMTKYGPRVIINTSKPIEMSDLAFHKGDMAKQARSMHVAKMAEKAKDNSYEASKTQEKTVQHSVTISHEPTASVPDGAVEVKNPAPVAPAADRITGKAADQVQPSKPQQSSEPENKGHDFIQNMPGPGSENDTNTAMDLTDNDMPF